MAILNATESGAVSKVKDCCEAKGINFAKLMEMILQLLALFLTPPTPPSP